MVFNYNDNNYEIVIIRKSIKNTYIRVKSDMKIYITTNKLTPKILLEKIVKDNKNSIIKMLEKQIKENNEKNYNYYLGMKINIMKINIIKKPYLEDNTLYIKEDKDIDKWYKKECERVFSERLNIIYNRFTKKIPYPSLTIRKMTTRWGVCNGKLKKVTLNSDLIYKDIKYLDYVIVHELSHLVHMNHSKSFWQLVEENEPNYKTIRKEMR